MKKYVCLLGGLGLLGACSKKNESVPQHTIVATVETGVNPILTVKETLNGKSTQLYNDSPSGPYKFTAPEGAQLIITASADVEPGGVENPDLLVTDNGITVPGIQNDNTIDSFYGQINFTVK